MRNDCLACDRLLQQSCLVQVGLHPYGPSILYEVLQQYIERLAHQCVVNPFQAVMIIKNIAYMSKNKDLTDRTRESYYLDTMEKSKLVLLAIFFKRNFFWGDLSNF